jgi:hypothetical protein
MILSDAADSRGTPDMEILGRWSGRFGAGSFGAAGRRLLTRIQGGMMSAAMDFPLVQQGGRTDSFAFSTRQRVTGGRPL